MATPDADWKSKYLKTLDQLERVQQKEKARQDVLRRGLVRVSVAAQGQDDQLDQRLNNVLSALRKQREILELEPMLADLENTVRGFDQRRRLKHETLAGLLDTQFGHYIESIRDRASRRRIAQFRKKFPGWAAGRGDQPELFRSYATLMDGIVREQGERLARYEQPADGPWWKRWWRRVTTPPVIADVAPMSVPPVRAPAVSPLQRTVPGAEEVLSLPLAPIEPFTPTSADELNIARQGDDPLAPLDAPEETCLRIASVLIQLLEQIDVPPSLAERRDALLKRLQCVADWDVLPDLLRETSELVTAIRLQGQQDMERFLVALYQRLQDIQDFLLTTRTREANAYAHQQQFTEGVRHELDQIRDTVNAGADIGRVRTDIEKVVARILAAVNDFQALERERQQALHADMEAMASRMRLLEDESQELRQRLEADRLSARKDSLTELPNRDGCDEQLAIELNRSRFKGVAFCVAVIKIDAFHEVNDQIGHLRGDKVLKLVAREIRRRVRPDDFVGRHAGETFLIITHDAKSAACAGMLEPVMTAVMNCPFNFNGERIPVTVSAGVALASVADTPVSLFERADQAMRRASQQGRNRLDLAP